MRRHITLILLLVSSVLVRSGKLPKDDHTIIELGDRPLYLISKMDDGPLKQELLACSEGPFKQTKFSIGHRGAPLRYPEHTEESYRAAAEMGAGILECDVTFTKDKVLVCRHSQCDLHTTTNILATPLAQKCSVPPKVGSKGVLTNASKIQCCTSDITAAEFKSLKGKIDAADKSATSIKAYMAGKPRWPVKTVVDYGTLLTHAESIELFRELGADFTPELKSPKVKMPYDGTYTQEAYAKHLIQEYKDAGIPPHRVWPQSFNYGDIDYWIKHFPDYAKQAVYLDGNYNLGLRRQTMEEWAANGLKILAPPMWMLLDVDSKAKIVPSDYAKNARAAGLDIITWTIERSGPLEKGGGWYYQTTNGGRGGIDVIDNDGDMYEVLDVLATDVGIKAIFSDWPATSTYYANCKGL